MDDDNKLFADHGTLRPDVVCGENAEFLYFVYWQAFECGFDVFRVDVFALFGDDHIFFAAAEAQMALRVEFAEVAGAEPAVHNGFGGGRRLASGAGPYGFGGNV